MKRRTLLRAFLFVTAIPIVKNIPRVRSARERAIAELTRALEAGNWPATVDAVFAGRPLKIESLEGTLKSVTYDSSHIADSKKGKA